MIVSGGASLWTAWQKQIAGVPVGRIALAAFALLVISGHFYARKQSPPE